MKTRIESELKKVIPKELVDELFYRHGYLKNKFLSGYFDHHNFEPAELNAGKFCEVVLRLLQHLTTNSYTPFGISIRFDYKLIKQFEQAPGIPDSIRIHIPRAIRVIYDVRSRRGVAHLGNKINPNLMDSMLVISISNWILSEFIRLYANKSPEVAQELIDTIVEKKIPILWEMDGKYMILDQKMKKTNEILIFLYKIGKKGATIGEINNLLSVKIQKVRGFITHLIKNKFIIKSPKTNCYVISPLGVSFVEKNVSLNVKI